MKKISCPKCNEKWHKDTLIEFYIRGGGVPVTLVYVKIQDLVVCPICFFTPKGEEFEYPEEYEARADRVILQESGVEIKGAVVVNEFGNYINMGIEDSEDLRLSDFNPFPDDDGGSVGSAQDLRDDAPHATIERLEAA